MDNLKNLPPFYIGQKVVCVEPNNINKPTKNQIYTINECIKTTCCGDWIVDVGVINNSPTKYTKCVKCGSLLNSIRYFSAFRFKPLEEQKLPLISLSKVIEQEKHLATAN